MFKSIAILIIFVVATITTSASTYEVEPPYGVNQNLLCNLVRNWQIAMAKDGYPKASYSLPEVEQDCR